MTYLGIVVGGVAGFLYWKFIGCASGTCPITSNKFISIAYGALLGSLLFSSIAGSATRKSFFGNLFSKDSASSYLNISPEEMMNLTSDTNYIVIDVRTPEEWRSGYIPETKYFIDYNSQDFNDKVLKLDTAGKYIIYCRSGNRSARACKTMHNLGFRHLYNLSGGIIKWNGDLKKDK
ncbi:MAG: rhodanese-like domain-containing protein [Bacteroidetes bacterium]|nr:rhodanese-like domain-containing protein [Bacteroidota bacterium]